MKRFVQFAALAFAFLVSGLALAFPSDYKAYGASPEELGKARAQASREGKQIFIYFRMLNCPPCAYVNGEFDSRATRNAFLGKYVFVEAWVKDSDGAPLGAQYGIKGAPHFVVLSPEGAPLCKSRGGFANQMEAQELGAGLARVKAWPAWAQPVSSSASPKCLDVVRNQNTTERRASTQ